MSAASHFSQTYTQARQRFIQAASREGLALQSYRHPQPGFDGEDLYMDVARLGPANARQVLLLSSACHGVEGFCGSGIQVALLHDTDWLSRVRQSQVAVVWIHALNPHGFSWWRRTTHENVDLNRNFVDFSQPLPRNTDYDAIAQAVVPEEWPAPPSAESTLAAYAAVHGERGLRAAIGNGQHHHPKGLFFAGHSPTWSHLTLRGVLRDHATSCERLAWIDFHTGLGPRGVGERIFAGREDAQALQRARQWWGPGVTSIFDDSSVSTQVRGTIGGAAYDEAPQAEFTSMALEYGTYSPEVVMQALRADQWMQNHPDQAASQRESIRRQLRDVFYVDAADWKEQVFEQGREAAWQAVQGLSQPI